MKTFKEFVYEAHLINTDPHDDYDIEKTDKMGPSQTTFKHRKTGIHVTYTHIGHNHDGSPVHSAAWHHPESEGKKETLHPRERVRIGLHGVRAVKDTLGRVPENSVIHASPTKDETEKSNTENTREGIYRRMGAGPASVDKETGEHNQYGRVGKGGKLSPLHPKDVKLTPEVRHEEEPEKPKRKPPSKEEQKSHYREMKRMEREEMRRARGG